LQRKRHIDVQKFLITTALRARGIQRCGVSADGAKKPNMVVIMADDVGLEYQRYHRGLMGGSTPNIDRIANEGACHR